MHLIIPENENQWSYMSVDLTQIEQTYCPNLLSFGEAAELFKRFDYDKNNQLDYRELQHFNAYIFKNFPRAGENERYTDDDRHFCGLPMKMFFTCSNLTHLDLSYQVTNILN